MRSSRVVDREFPKALEKAIAENVAMTQVKDTLRRFDRHQLTTEKAMAELEQACQWLKKRRA